MHKKTRIFATLLIAMFVLSPLASLMPASATITDRHTLFRIPMHIINDDDTLYFVPGDLIFNDEGDDLIRTKINDYSQGNLVAINISVQTISGANIWLWLSETGGATIEENDVFYAGPFSINDINDVVGNLTMVTDPASGQDFWVGNGTVAGPIPTDLVIPKGVPYYVKITDVAPTSSIPSSDVAVSINQWRPYESLKITPDMGPAGTLITVTGMAWLPDMLVNISWSVYPDSFASYTEVLTLIAPSEDGTFTGTFYAPDLMRTDGWNDTRSVIGYYNVSSPVIMDYENFTELGRRWLQVNTIPGGGWAGNGYADGQVGVFDMIYVSGIYFNPRGDVSLVLDWGMSGEIVLLSGIAVDSDGFFNVSVGIPITSVGWHTITAADFSWNFNATIEVLPTLVLDPVEGPVGIVVTATGYGFPKSDGFGNRANVTLTWDYTSA
jgi:hypothetical protein